MTDLKYKILEALYNAPDRSMRETDLLNLFLGNLNEAQPAYYELIRCDILVESSGKTQFTDTGLQIFESEHQRRKERAQDKAEREHAQQKADADRAKDRAETERQFLTNRNISIFAAVFAGLVALWGLIELLLRFF